MQHAHSHHAIRNPVSSNLKSIQNIKSIQVWRMEDNDAINIVIINPCKETCRCRSIIFLHPCPQLLPGAGRELGLSWGWVVCLIVNTNPRYTQHVQITGDPASAFVNQGSSCLKNQSEVQHFWLFCNCNFGGYIQLCLFCSKFRGQK